MKRTPPGNRTTKFQMRIDPVLLARIKQEAEKAGLSAAYWIQRVIEHEMILEEEAASKHLPAALNELCRRYPKWPRHVLSAAIMRGFGVARGWWGNGNQYEVGNEKQDIG